MKIDKREEIISLFESYSNFLTQSQKQAMHLKFVEDLSLQEISEIVATSRQAVNDAINKGINKLSKIKEKMS